MLHLVQQENSHWFSHLHFEHEFCLDCDWTRVDLRQSDKVCQLLLKPCACILVQRQHKGVIKCIARQHAGLQPLLGNMLQGRELWTAYRLSRRSSPPRACCCPQSKLQSGLAQLILYHS